MKRGIPVSTQLAAKQIGENLATWRKLSGLSSQQVADRVGVSRGTISRLENGDSSVSLAIFLSVCRAVGAQDIALATDPYETDLGRARADQNLPKRIRKSQ